MAQVQENGNILVNLPDKPGDELFSVKEIKYTSPTEFMYYGELDPCDELRMGYIHIIAKGGNVFGQINIEDEIYEIQDFGDNKNVLFKIDPDIYTEEECGVEYNSSKKGKETPVMQLKTHLCDVRVLVLFTALADARRKSSKQCKAFYPANQAIC